LARAVNLIIDHGKAGFYTGEIAQAVVNSVQEKGGVMTLEDLASYQVHVQEPVRGTYKGYEIMSASLPSSGGIGFLQIMNITENFEVYGKDSVEQIHLFSEINKMVYADRSAYITDSEISDVPKKGLTSKEYAAMLADKIDMGLSQKYTYNDPWVYEGDNTNGSVAVDSMGNMVALTKTLNYYWGSGVVVKDFGIVLNNQLDDFSFEENSVNVIQPIKTPLSSLAPTVISKEGKPAMLLSAPGGSKIFSIFAQLFSNVVDYGMTAEEAIQANRFIDMGESLDYSAPNLSKDTVKKLEALGHHLSNKNGSRFALPVMIAVDENGVKNGSTEFVDEGIFLDGCALGY
ncbi:MAG: gamma-glutamyltransferase, partial [Clostridiales bacterium]|nr:gamma-glutamyltransferase [Clostridiales bacterium]